MKITTRPDLTSHCKTASGTNWSNRWTYRIFKEVGCSLILPDAPPDAETVVSVEFATKCVQDDTECVQDASRRYECVQDAKECAYDGCAGRLLELVLEGGGLLLDLPGRPA